MTLKEMASAAEAIRTLCHSEGFICICTDRLDEFPRIHLTESEFLEHFGNVIPEPHSEKYDQRVIRWSGCEFFCLVER